MADITPTIAVILNHMIEAPKRPYYMTGICEALDMNSGTVSPLLRRLEQQGWLSSEVAARGSYQPRRYYRFTPEGLKQAKAELKGWNFADA